MYVSEESTASKFRIDDEGNSFCHNVCKLLLDYMVSHQKDGNHYLRIVVNSAVCGFQCECIWEVYIIISALTAYRGTSPLKHTLKRGSHTVKHLYLCFRACVQHFQNGDACSKRYDSLHILDQL